MDMGPLLISFILAGGDPGDVRPQDLHAPTLQSLTEYQAADFVVEPSWRGTGSRFAWDDIGYRSPVRNGLPMGGQVRDAVFLVGYDHLNVFKGPYSSGLQMVPDFGGADQVHQLLEGIRGSDRIGGDGVGPPPPPDR